MNTIQRPEMPADMLAYYEQGREVGRLFKGIGLLERERVQELIQRYFPPPPAEVLDVGGGPGFYACWLARLGFQVHLVDVIPLHIEQAQEAAAKQPDHPLVSATVADARQLDFPDACVDAVLFHGPLYHLMKRADRLAALREAKRVLRPGGKVLAVGITRYGSTLVGFQRWWLADPSYRQMIKTELDTGRHVPPATGSGLFTTAYFHTMEELEDEVVEAGLHHEATLAVQGPGWLGEGFEQNWADPQKREGMLEMIRWLETDPLALKMSPHLMAVAVNSA